MWKTPDPPTSRALLQPIGLARRIHALRPKVQMHQSGVKIQHTSVCRTKEGDLPDNDSLKKEHRLTLSKTHMTCKFDRCLRKWMGLKALNCFATWI